METKNNYKTIVYLTTNIKNNKIYIGVHNTYNPDKFDGYIGCGVNVFRSRTISHPSTPFQYAVKKYGFDAFIRSTIKIFDNREDALNLERLLVDENFILRDDTYNIVLGGGDPPIYEKPVYQYDLNGNFIKMHLSRSDAEYELGISSGVSSAVKCKTICKGFLWSDEKTDKLNINEYHIILQNKKIYSYDKFGNFIKEYNSISNFCKENKVTLGPVQRAIALKTKIKGFYLSDKKLDKFIKEKNIKKLEKVYQYDLDGNFIKEWNSCLEAYKNLGYGYSMISIKLKMGNPICGDYQWSKVKLKKMKSRKKYIFNKKICQYDLNGNLIKVWNSVRDCRKEFGNVSRVLSGKAKQCKGYTFKYYNS